MDAVERATERALAAADDCGDAADKRRALALVGVLRVQVRAPPRAGTAQRALSLDSVVNRQHGIGDVKGDAHTGATSQMFEHGTMQSPPQSCDGIITFDNRAAQRTVHGGSLSHEGATGESHGSAI